MDDPFYSSKFSIDWANDHIAEFEREMNAFFQLDNYTTVTDFDADGTHQLLKFKLTKQMPRALNGHTIDTVYNLRAALDQAICSVTMLSNLPTDYTFFPFARSETDFPNALNGRCGHLPKDIFNLVGTFEPYKGGNNLLWALNELCNTNKHGILRPVVMGTYSLMAEGTSQGSGLKIFQRPQWDRAKNEMILAEAPISAKFAMKYDYSFGIGFSDIEFINGKPVITTLNKFLSEVKGIVMAIEAEAQRIGLC